MLRYLMVLERDDNGTLLVSFPDIPEAHTFGEDEADALVRAKDALVTALETRIRDGEAIPRPSVIGKGMSSIAVPRLVELKLGLSEIPKSDVVRSSIDHVRPIETGEDLVKWVEALEGIGLGLAERANVRLIRR
jgi:predicted RNase H-like HicB family nuclease